MNDPNVLVEAINGVGTSITILTFVVVAIGVFIPMAVCLLIARLCRTYWEIGE